LRGKQYRESTGETDQVRAEKFLKGRMKEVGADQIGAMRFVTPQQEKSGSTRFSMTSWSTTNGAVNVEFPEKFLLQCRVR